MKNRKVLIFIGISLVLAIIAYLKVFSLSVELNNTLEVELLYIPIFLCVPLIFFTLIELLLDSRFKNKDVHK
jgi:hypothetical protein